MDNLDEILIRNPVVAAIRDEADLAIVIRSKVKIVFTLFGNIIDIADICNQLKAYQKTVFIHIDLVEGLRGDIKGIEYIKKMVDPYGIITTKSSNIKYAKNFNLQTIQRLFVIDSLSLKTGIKSIQAVQPSAVEVMPGVASKIIKSLEQEIHLPIIAGGLIETKKDIMESLSAGAVAISTTARNLWELGE